MDDHKARPRTFQAQISGKYISPRVLQCPEDKTADKNWAGLIGAAAGRLAPIADPVFGGVEQITDMSHSYFNSFDWVDALWEQVVKRPMGGVAACQLHGIGRPNWTAPDRQAFEGNVLRAVKDGSVISRQVFWGMESAVDAPGSATSGFGSESEFPFFLDPLE